MIVEGLVSGRCFNEAFGCAHICVGSPADRIDHTVTLFRCPPRERHAQLLDTLMMIAPTKLILHGENATSYSAFVYNMDSSRHYAALPEPGSWAH